MERTIKTLEAAKTQIIAIGCEKHPVERLLQMTKYIDEEIARIMLEQSKEEDIG